MIKPIKSAQYPLAQMKRSDIELADTLFSKTVPKREGVNPTTHKKRKVTLEDFKDEDNPQSLSAWNQQLLRPYRTVRDLNRKMYGREEHGDKENREGTGQVKTQTGAERKDDGPLTSISLGPRDIRITGDSDESANALCTLYRKGAKNRDQPAFKR
ncbi:hypothetical protein BJV77DRAFT_961845 [Russula vinacea]|nr:hypothetical protein BJV77DRAFT_961845 [Russula vinacea]